MGKPERYVVDAFDADEDGDFVGYQSYLELQEQAEKLAEAIVFARGFDNAEASFRYIEQALTAYQDWKKKNENL